MEEEIRKIKEETLRLKQEVREKTYGYILTALGLVAGLAWNEAIKETIDQFLPLSKDTIVAKFIYAVIITLVVVLISTVLLRRKKDELK